MVSSYTRCKILEQAVKHVSREKYLMLGVVYQGNSARAFLETENEACDLHHLAADSLASVLKGPVVVCLCIAPSPLIGCCGVSPALPRKLGGIFLHTRIFFDLWNGEEGESCGFVERSPTRDRR